MAKLTDCELVDVYPKLASITVRLTNPTDEVELSSWDLMDLDQGYDLNNPRKNRAAKALKAKILHH